jgi:hypothetical protein
MVLIQMLLTSSMRIVGIGVVVGLVQVDPGSEVIVGWEGERIGGVGGWMARSTTLLAHPLIKQINKIK